MTEVSLNAPGFTDSWATVQLEPTRIGAQGGPAFPELLIPFSVTLRPIDPHRGYGVYYPTDNDPIQHFSLLQLSGRLMLNGIPIGTIPATLTSLNTYNSQSNPLLLRIPLDLFRVGYIENRRTGNVSLHLEVTPWIAVHRLAPRKEQVTGYERFELGYFTLQEQIPQSHWIQQVLPSLGYGKMQLIEVPLPETLFGEQLAQALTVLHLAQNAMNEGDYAKVLHQCRSALEIVLKLRKYEGVPADPTKGPSFAEKVTYFIKLLPEDATGVSETHVASIFKALQGITSSAHHVSSPSYTRADAQLVLLLTTALLSYLGKVPPSDKTLKDAS